MLLRVLTGNLSYVANLCFDSNSGLFVNCYNLDMFQKTLDIAGRIHKVLIMRGATISVAESCTGGMLSHLLTLLPGSSAFFVTGIVVYSGKSKKKILGISGKTLTSYGVVSSETAKEMAEKVRALTGTDFSIATTGNLGPNAIEGKERGLIYIAVSGSFGTEVRALRLSGDRQANKEAASLQALKFLLEALKAA
jgi:PncC family amidohydrolase